MSREEYKDAIEVSVIFHEGQRMFAVPKQPAQQEPVAAVAWQQGYDQGVADERTSEANIGIAGVGAKVNPARNNPYTSPAAKRTWVGLSEEEKIKCASPYDSRLCCVEETEAKLKEKNT